MAYIGEGANPTTNDFDLVNVYSSFLDKEIPASAKTKNMILSLEY